MHSWNRTPAQNRYESDPAFRVLVDHMEANIHAAEYTPSEMREAALLASIHYELRSVRSMVLPLPKDVQDAMACLGKFRNAPNPARAWRPTQ